MDEESNKENSSPEKSEEEMIEMDVEDNAVNILDKKVLDVSHFPNSEKESLRDENCESNVVKEFKISKKSKILSKYVIEKRPMMRLAEVDQIIGEKADNFFMQPVENIKHEIRIMNHSTRFWLGVKFFRMNKLDFLPNANISKLYSQNEMSSLLGIERSLLGKSVGKIPKYESIIDVIKKRRYLSPIECNPRNKQPYFRKYASNFESLSQYFK